MDSGENPSAALEKALAEHVAASHWPAAAHTAVRLQRWLDAGSYYLNAGQPYDAAVCFQRGQSPRQCLEALLHVPLGSPQYRAACVHATRVALTLDVPLKRLAHFTVAFVSSPPVSTVEASAMKDLAAALVAEKRLREASEIYRRVLTAFPKDADAAEALAALQPGQAAEKAAASGRGKRFTEVLVMRGRLEAERLRQLATLHRDLEANDLPFGEALVADGAVSELDVVRALSESTGIAFISAARLVNSMSQEAARLLPADTCERWHVVPVAVIDKSFYVAMRDPRDIGLIDKLRFACGINQVRGLFATETALRQAMRKLLHGDEPGDLTAEEQRADDQQPMEMSRFSDRFTRTREQAFDTHEMMVRSEGDIAPPAPSAPREAGGEPAAVPMALAKAGTVIAGRYRLEELIGTGGSATVYRALDLELHESIALKLFANSAVVEQMLPRFKLELALSRQLSHPNVVRIFDLGSHESWRYLTLELLRGTDLGSKIGFQGALPIYLGLEYLEQACAGLQAAHDAGIIHRDVKPQNLFVTDEDQIKVMDFGIAKKEGGSSITVEGTIAGTPEYMSPEQINGFSKVTALTDLYALGATAYCVFTGAPPFPNRGLVALLLAQASAPPPPPCEKNPEIPPALEAVILKLLEKDPAKRFQSCRELAAELKKIREALPPL